MPKGHPMKPYYHNIKKNKQKLYFKTVGSCPQSFSSIATAFVALFEPDRASLRRTQLIGGAEKCEQQRVLKYNFYLFFFIFWQ